MVNPIVFEAAIDSELYFDIANLEDPFTVITPIGISNNEDQILYFEVLVIGPPAGWAATPQQLGSVASHDSELFLFEPTRTTPVLAAGELDENITLRINAYTDAIYTILYATQTLAVTVHWFDHTDVAWTVIDHDNFDGGTLEGWVNLVEVIDVSFASSQWIGGVRILSDAFITAPYSISLLTMQKQFDASAYSKARIIIHFKKGGGWQQAIKIGSDLILTGAVSLVLPDNEWIRMAYSFPVGASAYVKMQSGGQPSHGDEIWVIAK